MAFCERCGQKFRSNTKFCGACGAKKAEIKVDTDRPRPNKSHHSLPHHQGFEGWHFILILFCVTASIFLLVQIYSFHKSQADTQAKLNELESKKASCDRLKLQIRPYSIGLAQVGINFCIESSDYGSAKLTLHYKDGRTYSREVEFISANKCWWEQFRSDTAGLPSSDYADLSYIEVVSNECPQVRDIVRDVKFLEDA